MMLPGGAHRRGKRASGELPGSRWYARLYDIVMRAEDRLGLARYRRELVRRARGRVLEIGAGTGLEFPHYSAGVVVYAIEPDAEMLERARERAKAAGADITCIVADALALPFRGRTFDSVVSALAFCTIAEPERAAGEIRRVLRRDGAVHLLEHVRAEHDLVARLQERLTPLWRRLAGGCHLDRRTADIFSACGFEVDVGRAMLSGIFVELTAVPTQTPAVRADNHHPATGVGAHICQD